MLPLLSSAPGRRPSHITWIATVVGVTLLFSAGPASAAPPSAGWSISSLAQPTNFSAGDTTIRGEVQNVYVNATAGTFTLGYEGETTAPINYNATAAEVEAALATKIGLGRSRPPAGLPAKAT